MRSVRKMHFVILHFFAYTNLENGIVPCIVSRQLSLSQVSARPSSQLARIVHAQGRNLHCKLLGGRHRNLNAHCNRRIIYASQVACASSLRRRKGNYDRRELLRGIADASQVACATFLRLPAMTATNFYARFLARRGFQR